MSIIFGDPEKQVLFDTAVKAQTELTVFIEQFKAHLTDIELRRLDRIQNVLSEGINKVYSFAHGYQGDEVW